MPYAGRQSEDYVVKGLDIGCGANLIYPLLGASVFNWKFVAVDNTAEAMGAAEQNLALNTHLQGLIELRDARNSPHQVLALN